MFFPSLNFLSRRKLFSDPGVVKYNKISNSGEVMVRLSSIQCVSKTRAVQCFVVNNKRPIWLQVVSPDVYLSFIRLLGETTSCSKGGKCYHPVNHYLVDNALDVPNPYPPESDLSGEYCYPPFERMGQGSSQTRSWILLTGYVDRFFFSLILTEFSYNWLEKGRNSYQKRGSLYSRKLPFAYLCRSRMIVPQQLS